MARKKARNLALALAALALLLAIVWSTRTPHARANAAAPRASTEQPLVPQETAGVALVAPGGLEPARAVGPVPAPATAVAVETNATLAGTVARYEFELEVLVRAPMDRPVAGASVQIAPLEHPFCVAGTTDTEGRLTVRWRGVASYMELDVCTRGGSGTSDLVRVGIFAGRRQTCRILCAEGLGGEELQALQALGYVGSSSKDQQKRLRASAHLAVSVGNDLDVVVEAKTSKLKEDEHIEFVDPWLPAKVESIEVEIQPVEQTPPASAPAPDEWATAIGGRASHKLDQLPRKTRGRIQGVLELSRVQALGGVDGARVEGTVVDENDEAVERAAVRVEGVGGDVVAAAWSDREGHFAMGGLPPGEFELRAISPGIGAASRRVALGPGTRSSWNAKLTPGLAIAGRLVDDADQPLVDWLVEWALDDAFAPGGDSVETDRDGRFRCTNLPAHPVALLARPGKGDGLPVLVRANVLPSSVSIEAEFAVLGASSPAGLALRVLDSDGEPPDRTSIRVWRVDTEHGREMVSDERHGMFLGGLVCGNYAIEIGAPGAGWKHVDNVRLGPGERLDLGGIALAAPARVEVRSIADDAMRVGCFLVRCREDVLSRSRKFELECPARLEIPRGDYELYLALDEPRLIATFSAASGATTRVEIDPRSWSTTHESAAPLEAR